jgi:aspartokinase
MLFELRYLIGDYSVKIQDQILAQGEVLSAKLIVFLLNHRGIPGKLADTVTDSNWNGETLDAVSKKNIIQIFNENKEAILVITGFIGSNDSTKPQL